MIIQCPNCELRLKPKPPPSTPPDTKVSVKCKCGTVLIFRMPGRPRDPRLDEFIKSIFGNIPKF